MSARMRERVEKNTVVHIQKNVAVRKKMSNYYYYSLTSSLSHCSEKNKDFESRGGSITTDNFSGVVDHI